MNMEIQCMQQTSKASASHILAHIEEGTRFDFGLKASGRSITSTSVESNRKKGPGSPVRCIGASLGSSVPNFVSKVDQDEVDGYSFKPVSRSVKGTLGKMEWNETYLEELEDLAILKARYFRTFSYREISCIIFSVWLQMLQAEMLLPLVYYIHFELKLFGVLIPNLVRHTVQVKESCRCCRVNLGKGVDLRVKAWIMSSWNLRQLGKQRKEETSDFEVRGKFEDGGRKKGSNDLRSFGVHKYDLYHGNNFRVHRPSAGSIGVQRFEVKFDVVWGQWDVEWQICTARGLNQARLNEGRHMNQVGFVELKPIRVTQELKFKPFERGSVQEWIPNQRRD
ncbi:hypothetical protein C8F04DRAFT_1184469 [Mycena alexandri]|uniref:Uncharacterized protein n=1 Tax=Mycena alexandri TaxID=1745969 RepID=A0AAD6SS03_9AGAR|nr:hypothetical protein C8F04DRAFT_1184469 [Mycena alexandri]